MSLGKTLASLRKEIKLTQQQLASALEITRGALSMYELDKREPDNNTLIKISDYFDVSTDYLLGKTETKNICAEKPSPYTTSLEGLDKEDITLVENLIKSLRDKRSDK